VEIGVAKGFGRGTKERGKEEIAGPSN